MIVYGDPQYEIESSRARHRLREYLQFAESGQLDAARDLLIAAGQIEQAIADAGSDPSEITRATDLLASYFVRIYLGEWPGPAVLQAAAGCLDAVLGKPGRLRIKLPEGFAFYTLYPEQYCEAARAWMLSRPPSPVLVIGIRSIGTTLSAVVKSTFGQSGWRAERITVRPTGHPFERTVRLPKGAICERAIVVDEGPGLSGSSMASVARALREQGVRDIAFFPGHSHPPGSAASEEVRKLWGEIPAIVCPAIPPDLSQSWVLQSLRQSSEMILDSPVAEILDLSAGRWRSILGQQSIQATPALERAKYLVRCENGRALLWKFAGLGPGRSLEPLAAGAFARQLRLGKSRWCQTPARLLLGFVATEWTGGRSLSPADLDQRILLRLARYIRTSSRKPLPPSELQQSLTRLAEMLRWNLHQAGLDVSPPPLPAQLEKVRSSGDGHLAPHEWILAGRRIVKTDVWGHDFDHTVIGRQPILWDLASAIVEWRMIPSQSAGLFQELEKAGLRFDPATLQETLRFFLLSYCAFRIGTAELNGDRPAMQEYATLARHFIGHEVVRSV